MATRYELIRENLAAWSNRDKDIFGKTTTSQNQLLDTFLSYSADECYRRLRIPALETDRQYTIDSDSVIGSGRDSYNKISIPVDFTEMISIRFVSGQANIQPNNVVFERKDEAVFFDSYSMRYSSYSWMRSGDYFYIRPALPVGAVVNFHYYRVLPSLQATYSVIPSNILWTSDTVKTPSATQPFLTTVTEGGTTLYSITLTKEGATSPISYYSTVSERDTAYASYTPPTGYTKSTSSSMFSGKEVGNWVRDQNEKCLLWGALAKLYQFLSDPEQENRFTTLYDTEIERLNQEENRRKVQGGTTQVSFSNSLL